MEIKGYSDIEVLLLRQTEAPRELVEMALNITMKQDFGVKNKDLSGLIKSIIEMNHTSPLEHVGYTFLIKGASRSFLAQITRHRMSSFTSGSQHYQNYFGYNFRVSDKYKDNPKIKEAAKQAIKLYADLIHDGIPKEEARQILPNGMENNLLYTVNARSLMNFLNLRLCERNTEEIRTVAKKIYNLVQPTLPELWDNVGPDCYMFGKCSQGKMKCKDGYRR